MLSKVIGLIKAAALLDMKDVDELVRASVAGELPSLESSSRRPRFLVEDLVKFQLSRAIRNVGVPKEKAMAYAEAVLGNRMPQGEKKIMEWIENDDQELFCTVADAQLSRIFLRSKEGEKEIDVGAVRPVLFPTTISEINVFRVIRPVVKRAQRLFAKP